VEQQPKIRLGGVASKTYLVAFPAFQEHFQKRGIDLDWVLYSSWDALVDAFVSKEVDLAWNGPLAYVKIKRRLGEHCRVVAMRDNDVDLIINFITGPNSGIHTVEDLHGKRFAFGSRSSVEAGLLAYHFLKGTGINPRHDLETCSFYEDRKPVSSSDQADVVQRVMSGEYDAGAVCQNTLESMKERGELQAGTIGIFWSSPGYSHCCFTAHNDLDGRISQMITSAFVSMDYSDPLGKTAMDAEQCKAFIPGITHGWEMLEQVAQEEGLL